MKIGDRCFVHGYVDEIRRDTVIVRNKGGYFGTDPGDVFVVFDTTHPNWISCKDKLPEYGTEVLTYSLCGLIEIQSLENHIWNCHWENQHGDYEDLEGVSAWMPLPEPYAERRTNE